MAVNQAKSVLEDTQNIIATVEGYELVIRIDLSKELYESWSGKSTIVATTSGRKLVLGSNDVIIDINAYRMK